MMPAPATLPAVIAARAAEDPEREFLVDAVTDRTWTYGAVLRRALQWSAALEGLGVAAGDAVATMLRNEPESVAVWVGIAYLGGIEVPGNMDYRGSLLHHYLSTSRARVAVVDASCAGTVAAVAGELTVVVVGEGERASGDGTVAAESLPALGEAPAEHALPEIPLSDTATVMFTSGTTGPSKGVVIPWMQLHESAVGWVPIGGTTAGEGTHTDEHLALDPCYYSPFPFHHMASRAPVHLMALLGGRAVLRPSFKTDLFWPEVSRYGCTSTELLGTMALFLQGATPCEAERENPLRSVLMVPLIPDLEAFQQRFGVRVWTVYNMTELSVPLVTNGYDLVDNASCGRVRPGYECRIVDEDELPVGPDVVGELVVRAGRPWSLMNGYWGMPEATVEAWRNLWFHTGDAFRRDANGNFYFVDRLKDTIRRRGENVSSIELETEVRSHDDVADAAAVGVPSDLGEEDVKIVVVRRAGAATSEEELRAYLGDRLPRFMVPRYVEWADDLPKTPTQKVRKAVLREDWRTPGTWDATSRSYLDERRAVAESRPARDETAAE